MLRFAGPCRWRPLSSNVSNHMESTHLWPAEFATIVACKACSSSQSAKLLRDDEHNVPQPGYIGRRYWKRRVLLVGQNPAATDRFTAEDQRYTSALQGLRDSPDEPHYRQVELLLDAFIPKWPVHGNYFPLRECGLGLDEIAYFNAVRCRTIANATPDTRMSQNCVQRHLARWFDLLEPRVVVFVGKWAADQAAHEVERRNIPSAFMNRQRSLSAAERAQNRSAVITRVQARGC